MKSRTEVVWEGEKLGPIDWNHPFIDSFGNYCCNDEQKQKYCDEAVAHLRKVVEMFSEDGPRIQVQCSEYWYDVIDVGMYDGWPFWKPMPAVQTLDNVFRTAKWDFFYELRGVRLKP